MSDSMAKAKIMSVDDSPLIHKIVGKALLPAGFEICGICSNGREAVESYPAILPDLLIMDITMPVMDGLEAAQAIIADFPQAKIMLLSAMGDDELLARARSIGVGAFMTKPFKAQELVQAVESYLNLAST